MAPTLNFSTGPVSMASDALNVLAYPPIPHRSTEFRDLFMQLKSELCKSMHCQKAFLLNGSGTLANEAMIAQIKAREGKGLIVSNGEFGERLMALAARQHLHYSTLILNWGDQIEVSQLSEELRTRKPDWLLLCHSETSTGVVNPLIPISLLCKLQGVLLFVDCISSVGNMELDLSHVAMATCSSGKGLGSIPGLAIVLSNLPILEAKEAPRYIDLKVYESSEGIPFTLPSNMIHSLYKAIKKTLSFAHWVKIKNQSTQMREALLSKGFRMVNDRPEVFSHVFTIAFEGDNSVATGDSLYKKGVLCSYRSNYLIERNWIQLAVMGQHQHWEIDHVVNCLEKSLELTSIAKVPVN